eukprot:TRINITY_DN17492_c0_g1_i3.p1 TRINITY_DN17492_c0_g1~~TRINITY_DN17492_c0_g1_i3.p1  ORF type:complete len:123 (-),score=33.29 TRINITY_DN17492_c0_g1_i3:59-427(-)
MGCSGSKDNADSGSKSGGTGKVLDTERKEMFAKIGNPDNNPGQSVQNIFKPQVEKWLVRVNDPKDVQSKDKVHEQASSLWLDLAGDAQTQKVGLDGWRKWLAKKADQDGEAEFRTWFNRHNV